jgi:hypothetical protein
MPGLTPSSPPNASATVRGLVSTLAQTFAGAKTFLARAVFQLGITAGLARLDLRSDLGAGASDVCNVVGSTVADASVNATADLWSARTGIGGTEVTHARLVKGAMIVDESVAFGRFLSDRPGVSQGQVGHRIALAELGLYNLNGAGALALNLGTGSSRASGSFTAGGNLNSTAGVFAAGAGMSVDVRGTLGAGASDVVSKVGTTLADGSVNALAKLFSVRTGLGGTEVEKIWIDKQGDFRAGAPTFGLFRGASASLGFVSVDDSIGAQMRFGAIRWVLDNGSATLTDQAVLGNLVRFEINGRQSHLGTDSTGTPGAATINRPTGKSAIAAGASSVVITNSLVTAASRVIITPHARDATCKEIIAVPAAGSFTVSGTANATAALPFSWEISNII